MTPESELSTKSAERQGSLVVLAFVSLIVGMASGLLGAVFRLALEQADQFRDAVLTWAHGREVTGLLLMIGGSAVATGLAAWLVRRHSPQASGSGIPHVEAVINGELPPAPFRLIPVKFFGGLLAIGSGLALGREGPSVQMGASLAHLLGAVFRRDWPDCMVLLAAGAGAGLATAFNAPIAGAVFVLEELVRRFDTRITITTLGASAGAIAVVRVGVPGVLEQKTSILCNPLDLLIYIGPIPIISTLAKQTAGDVDENLFHGLNSTIIVEKIKCFGPRWT